jgi:hypothetical protein
MKIYKRTIYWVSTNRFCGAIAKDQDGLIYEPDTAPYYKFMAGKSFRDLMDQLKRSKKLYGCKRIEVDVDPF